MQRFPESWLFPSSIVEAKKIQTAMAQKVVLEDTFKDPFALIAGMDVSNNRFDPTKRVFASVVLLSFPDLFVLEKGEKQQRQPFPYVPGLLGFREAPVLVEAFNQLSKRPDLILIDGHGISHPRGLGIASHLGVLLDIPTIGVAKSILIGSPFGCLGDEVGSQTPLVWKEKCIGMMVRSKKRCSPLIVSSGHKISLKTAVEIVKQCVKGYRLPEPIRQAHLNANLCRKQAS